VHLQLTDLEEAGRPILDESRVAAGVVAVVSLTVGLTASNRDDEVLAESSPLSLFASQDSTSMERWNAVGFWALAAWLTVHPKASDHQLWMICAPAELVQIDSG